MDPERGNSKLDDIRSKIKSLENEMDKTQRNKSTEGHLGFLKQKLAKMKTIEKKLIEESEVTVPTAPQIAHTPVKVKKTALKKDSIAVPSLMSLSPALRSSILSLGKGATATRERSIAELQQSVSMESDEGQLTLFASVWGAIVNPTVFDPSSNVRLGCMKLSSILLKYSNEQTIGLIVPVVFHTRFDESKQVCDAASAAMKGIDITKYREGISGYLLNCFDVFAVSPNQESAKDIPTKGTAVQHLLRLSESYEAFKAQSDKILAQTMFAILPFIKGFNSKDPKENVIQLMQHVKKIIKETVINPKQLSGTDVSILAEAAVSVYSSFCEKADISKEQNFIQNININNLLKNHSHNGRVINPIAKLYCLCGARCLNHVKVLYNEYSEHPQSIPLESKVIELLTGVLAQFSKSPEDVLEPLFINLEQGQWISSNTNIISVSLDNKSIIPGLLQRHTTVAIAFALTLLDEEHKEETNTILKAAIEESARGECSINEVSLIHAFKAGEIQYMMTDNSFCLLKFLIEKTSFDAISALFGSLTPEQTRDLFLSAKGESMTFAPLQLLSAKMFANGGDSRINTHEFVDDLILSLSDPKVANDILTHKELIKALELVPQDVLFEFGDKYMGHFIDTCPKSPSRSSSANSASPVTKRGEDIETLFVSISELLLNVFAALDKEKEMLTPDNAKSGHLQLLFVKALMTLKCGVDFDIPEVPLCFWGELGVVINRSLQSNNNIKLIAKILGCLTKGNNIEGGRELAGWTAEGDLEKKRMAKVGKWKEALAELNYPPYSNGSFDDFISLSCCSLGLIEGIFIAEMRQSSPEGNGFVPWGMESFDMFPVLPFAIATFLPPAPPVSEWYIARKEDKVIKFLYSDILESFRLSIFEDVTFLLCFGATPKSCLKKVFEIVDGCTVSTPVHKLEILACCLFSLLTGGEYFLHELNAKHLRIRDKPIWNVEEPLCVMEKDPLPEQAKELLRRMGGGAPSEQKKLKVNSREGLILSLLSITLGFGVDIDKWDNLEAVVYCLALSVLCKIGSGSIRFMEKSLAGFSMSFYERQKSAFETLIKRPGKRQSFLKISEHLLSRTINKLTEVHVDSKEVKLKEEYFPKTSRIFAAVEHVTRDTSDELELAVDKVDALISAVVRSVGVLIERTPTVSKSLVLNPYRGVSYSALVASTSSCMECCSVEDQERYVTKILDASKRTIPKKKSNTPFSANEPMYVTISVITSILLKGIEYGGTIDVHATDVPTHSILSHNDSELRLHCMELLTNTEPNVLYSLLSLALEQPKEKLSCIDLYKYLLKGVTPIERGDMSDKDTIDCITMKIPTKVETENGPRRRTYPEVSIVLSGLVCANITRWVNVPLSDRPPLLAKLLPSGAGKLFADAALDSVIEVINGVKLTTAALSYDSTRGKDNMIMKIKVDYERASYPATFGIMMKYQVTPLPTPPTVTLSGEFPCSLDKVKSLLSVAASKGATCYGCSAEIVANILSISGLIAGESLTLEEEESLCPICFCVVNETNRKVIIKCKVCTTIMHRQCFAEYKYVNPEGTCPICRR